MARPARRTRPMIGIAPVILSTPFAIHHSSLSPAERVLFLRDEPRPRTEGEVGIRPLEHDADAISEAGEIGDVHQHPGPPADQAGEAETAEVRDGAVPADDRKRS